MPTASPTAEAPTRGDRPGVVPIAPIGPTVVLGAMAGALGWGIRGQYGHETGAMIAGLLVALVLVSRFAPGLDSLSAARAIAWCTVATGFGGSMTYGQTVGLTHDAPLVGHWAALRWGMIGLALKGGLWIGFPGVFLGMGLGNRRYRPTALLLLMSGLVVAFALGVACLNSPFDPDRRILPWLYFSDDWQWEPGAVLHPRREVWGGMLLALTTLFLYVGVHRRDRLACRLGLWGIAAGAVGFPLGQCLQAFHAWNPRLFSNAALAGIDPFVNWWNCMETLFGAVIGGGLALGLGLNRRDIACGRERAKVTLGPALEWTLLGLHSALLVISEFGTDFYSEVGLMMGAIPIVAVAGGRRWPYFVVLPLTLIPIAGKTVGRLVYEEPLLPPLAGWLVLLGLPLAITTLSAVVCSSRERSAGTSAPFMRRTLLLVIWLYFGLNHALFRLPAPWLPWTPRTFNDLVFACCSLVLTGAVAVAAFREGRRSDYHPGTG